MLRRIWTYSIEPEVEDGIAEGTSRKAWGVQFFDHEATLNVRRVLLRPSGWESCWKHDGTFEHTSKSVLVGNGWYVCLPEHTVTLNRDGDDGWWSTFHIQVGSPPQTLRVLPGTSASAGSVSWIVSAEMSPLQTCMLIVTRSMTWVAQP